MRVSAAVVAVALSIAGCSSSNVYQTETARPNAVEFQSKISNPFLAQQVEVTSVYVGTASDLLRVQANIRNISANAVRYMYKVTWFDAQGLKISANADFWTRRELNAGGLDQVSAIAPSMAGADWRLEIRPWDA